MNRIKKTFLLIVVLMSFLLVACNQSVEFTIYFDSKGGSEVSSISTGGNSAVVIPTNPTKEGFEFDGWYWDNNTFNRPFTANSLLEEPISSNMTVYAKWISEAEYSITYVLNSGALSSGVNNTYKIEELPLTLPVPIRDGYEFDGWYTNENLEGSQVTSISLGEEDNKTYYAKWTSSEGEDFGIVTATGFEIDGTNMYIEVPNTTTTYSFIGQIIVSSQATWDLYIDVLGIYRIATKTISPSIGDNTVYIVVTKDDEIKLYTVTVRRLPIYEVSFNTDGGSLLESQFIQEGDMLQEPTTIKSGYTLIGWEDDNNEVTFPIKIEEDMLIKAKWEVNQNTLSFDSNGGVGEMGSVLVETNETTALPKNTFTRIGYTFVGWSTNEIGEVEYLDEANYTMGTLASYTLYAKWVINSYTLELTRSNALAGSVTGSGIKEYNSEVTITATTNPGYTFIGWYNDEDLVSSLATYTFNMPASDLSYEAKWEANQYTITFVTNGGTEISPITQDYGTAIHVSTTKEGYMFEAWCSDEGLTTSIDISKMPNANLTVYAKWAQMYVYYGTYPQTVVDDSSLISSLNSLTSTNANGYYEYLGEEYAKVVANPCETGYKFINGSTIQSGQTYYFKVEPIKWRVLEAADGIYTLLSEYIIDKQVFYTSSDNRTIGGQTIYANNYKHSTIREWLNYTFYNKAFSTPEKGSILTTLVDNSASTTSSSTNPYFSNNTMDKVYLLSYQEARSSIYGFSTSTDPSSTRTAVTTDYARAVGAYMNTSTSNYGTGVWWLRSPFNYYSSNAHNVNIEGSISSNVYNSYNGARPAIKIG